MPTKDEESIEEISLLMKVADPIAYKADLQHRKNFFEEKIIFAEGDIVVWKSGLKNRSIPNYDEPGIVIKTFNPAIIDPDREIVSTYYNELLDVLVGFITKDDEFIIFLHDGRRLKKYEK